MANMFTNTARMFKFDVLVAYAKQAFEEGKIDEAKINAYAIRLRTIRVRSFRSLMRHATAARSTKSG